MTGPEAFCREIGSPDDDDNNDLEFNYSNIDIQGGRGNNDVTAFLDNSEIERVREGGGMRDEMIDRDRKEKKER